MSEGENIPTVEQLRNNWNKVMDGVRGAAAKCGRNPEEITVVAVSKTHPKEFIERGVEAGIEVFGENYAQELRDKHAEFGEFNKKIRWHYIGHLQSNKVKYLAPFVEMIHSVDSLKLAKEISKQAKKHERVQDILLQVNTSGEDSKSGCPPGGIDELAEKALQVDSVNVRGLMTIGTFSDDEKIIRGEFSMLRKLRDDLAKKFGDSHFKDLSMGMTHDFPIAVDEGATYVRVGTAIFGPREYKK